MKRIKYILLLIIFIPISAYAYDIKCPTGPFKYQDTFECTIEGDNTFNYDELSGTIQLENNSLLTCEYEEPTNGFSLVSGDSASQFYFKGTSNSTELVKIKCEVSGKADSSKREQVIIPDLKYHIFDSNLDASNEVLRSSYIAISAYVEPTTIDPNAKPRDTSNPDVRLKALSDENLKFTFSAFKTEYDISVLFDVNQLNLNVVPNNDSATYEIIGSQALEIGDNTIDILVTSPDGEKKLCYTLNIKRLKRGEEVYYHEKDSSLKSLTIEGYSINFESIILDYTITLKHDVDKINVSAQSTNDKAQVSVSRTEELKSGDIVEVVVTSEDGSSKTTYMINIKKEAPPKDYRTTIYIGVFVVAISIVLLIILKTNRNNKKNPLLKNKNKQLNSTSGDNVVPVVNSEPVDLNNSVQPQVTEEVVDNNFNVATSTVNTLDLSNAQLPNELQPTVIPNGESVNQDNTNIQQ